MPQQDAANTPPERQDDISGTAGENVAALQSGTSDATATREDLEDRLLRALAEQVNIRERALREVDYATKFASSQFAGDLLDTIDNLRLAIASIPGAATADPGMKPLIAGIIATERALMSALAKHGIVPINALDQPFDPAFHEAIHLVADKDRPSETVIEVIKPGYMHHDRLLRPAAVRVTAAPESDEGR
jgi:molecular chaperone GrpE